MSADLPTAIKQLHDLVEANVGVGDDFCPYIHNGAWTLGGMRALLAVLEPQPMDSAPQKEDPHILAFWPEYGWCQTWFVRKSEYHGDVWCTSVGKPREPGHRRAPTHWLPLLPRPALQRAT